MKLLPSQTDERSLARLGEEVVALLTRRDFAAVADRFGYSLAYGREAAAAIEADFLRAASAPLDAAEEEGPSIKVTPFKPNLMGLCAMVECRVTVAEGAAIRIELIVAEKEGAKHITLDEISGLLCCSPPPR